MKRREKSEGEAGRIRVQIINRQRRRRVDRNRLERVAAFVLQALGFEEAEVSIVLTGDRQIQELSRRYLGRDRPTDVLAFSQIEGAGGQLHPGLLGDVVISVETADTQAMARGKELAEELTVLLIHGILHLVGYNHTGNRQEAARMDGRQRALIRRVRGRFPGRDSSPSGARTRPERALHRKVYGPSLM